MSVAVDKTYSVFLSVEANTPLSCTFTLFSKSDLVVYYGKERLVAVQDSDYTVSIASGYASFTVTPKAALIAKILALIAFDATEINYIEVRREPALTSDTTPAAARSSESVSREFDKVATRIQSVAEKISRMFRLPVRSTDIEDYNFELPEWQANRALTWHPTLKRLVNSSQNVNESATSQALASAAEAAASAASAAADKTAAQAAKTAAETAAATSTGIAGSGTGLPAGGTAGQALFKTGPNPSDRAWQDLSAAAVASTTHSYTDAGATFNDTDEVAGNLAAGAGRKWLWGNVRAWLATQFANLFVKTGTLVYGLWFTAPAGYIEANGATIGNASSGATGRANADTSALFALAWALNPTEAPIYDSLGAPSTRGASAAADFAANKRVVVPRADGEWVRGWDNGRGVNAGRRLGEQQAEMVGSHTHNLSISSAGDHAHTVTADGTSRRGANGNNYGTRWYGSSGDSTDGGTGTRVTATAGAHTHAGTASANSGTENRVRGIALLACWKL